MDEQSSIAINFLDALVYSRARLYGFSWALYGKYASPGLNIIQTAKVSPTQFHYQSRNNVPAEETASGRRQVARVGFASSGVYALLLSENWIEWGLDIRWDLEKWFVSADVSYVVKNINYDSENNGEVIQDFETKETQSLTECIRYIEQATDFLVDHDGASRILNLYKTK